MALSQYGMKPSTSAVSELPDRFLPVQVVPFEEPVIRLDALAIFSGPFIILTEAILKSSYSSSACT